MVLELAPLVNPEGTPDRWSRISANFPMKDDLQKEEGGNSGDGCILGMAPEQRPPKDQNTSFGSGRRSQIIFTGTCNLWEGGLEEHISTYSVTKTPVQVASHAQKFFIRQKQDMERKRKNIHDVTNP
ncbi:transcription factor DIVARICATA-like [Elaeis guineensis]|uniref:transcription factor DIVARICATA-like n=1 Tax=Elaeis guineensis var. tenera TaxID=51953 RepID=UPI003C6D7B12